MLDLNFQFPYNNGECSLNEIFLLDLNFQFPYNNGECSLNEIFRKKFRMKYRIPFAVRTGREKK